MLNLDKLFTHYNIHHFNEELVTWFNREKRDLPWRHAKNPYRVWVSEVMLQQTRVDTVIPYYNRFMERFPTLEDLAAADTDEVVKYWEGLGYYSRVRNVMRVMSRQFGIYDDIALPKTRKIFEQVVRRLMDPTHASDFNEGVMELGATVCTPKNPMCSLCPVQDTCYAYTHNVQEELPVKTKKGAARVEMYDALYIEKEGKVAYVKRADKGLFAGMWQYPLMDRGTGEQLNGTYLGQVKHVFSHIVWYIDLYRVDTLPTDDVVWLDASEREVKTVSVAQQKLERLVGDERETI